MIRHAMNRPGLRAILVLSTAVLLLLAVALLPAGCGGSATTTGAPTTASQTTATTGTAGGGGTTVTMKQFAFNPASVTVKVGDTVTWENQDGVAHDVIAADGSFKSAEFGQGKTFSFTFTKAGTYKYSCKIHPGMDGTVIVQ
jgi:plastocyanin